MYQCCSSFQNGLQNVELTLAEKSASLAVVTSGFGLALGAEPPRPPLPSAIVSLHMVAQAAADGGAWDSHTGEGTAGQVDAGQLAH